MRRHLVMLVGMLAAALAVASVAAATPRGIGNAHWATTVEPFQWNAGYGGSFTAEVDAAHIDWDGALSTAGSHRVGLAAADQEVPIVDVANTGQGYSGITYIRRDAHGALTSGTRIEVVAPAAMSAFNRRLVYEHEIGHAKGLDHPADLYGACTEVMSYCGRVNQPSQAEINQIDIQQNHLDSYTTLRGPLSGGAPPPQPVAACADGIDNDRDGRIDYPSDPGCSSSSDGDETDTAPPPQPPSGSEDIEPNSTLRRGAWWTDTRRPINAVLRDGVQPPDLPANGYDFAGTRSTSSYEVGLDDIAATGGRFDVAAHVHVDQRGSRTRSDYALYTTRNGARVRVGLLDDVTGPIDGTRPSAWKQVVARGLSAAEVNSLTFVASKDRSTDGSSSGSVFNQAVTVAVTPAAAATGGATLRFGAVRRDGSRFRFGLGPAGEVTIWADRFGRRPIGVDTATGLPKGAVKLVQRKLREARRSSRRKPPA